MSDLLLHWQKLRADAAECAPISDLATDPVKRALYAQLAEHLRVLASEIEKMIANNAGDAAR